MIEEYLVVKYEDESAFGYCKLELFIKPQVQSMAFSDMATCNKTRLEVSQT